MEKTKYIILPFRYEYFKSNEVLLTNDCGDFAFISKDQFQHFVNGNLEENSEGFLNLESKHFLTRENLNEVIKILAIKYRTKKSVLRDFTTLHMVVPTLRCNSSCIYCQVARRNIKDFGCDMDKNTAKNVVKTIFKSPSKNIKIEFQGGDPSLNIPMVKYIIDLAETENILKKRNLEFVICTNMTLLKEADIKYLFKHKCYISTSLDGPGFIHNANRPLQNKELNPYKIFCEKTKLISQLYGEKFNPSALMTTSRNTLGHVHEVIDEYVKQGYTSIFLRALNPYGYAKKRREKIAYPVDEFIKNYLDGLDYILELNKQGVHFIENYASLLLRRILTPFATGVVDLQSPAGAGIVCALYNYDGNVYASDEARMMARFGDQTFCLGNVNTNSYEEMFNGKLIHSIVRNSITESLPGCSDCVFEPYCGGDPVRNTSEQGDMIGYRPTNEMCKRNRAIMHHLFDLIHRDDPSINKILFSWISD